jgi:hypothetical protein
MRSAPVSLLTTLCRQSGRPYVVAGSRGGRCSDTLEATDNEFVTPVLRLVRPAAGLLSGNALRPSRRCNAATVWACLPRTPWCWIRHLSTPVTSSKGLSTAGLREVTQHLGKISTKPNWPVPDAPRQSRLLQVDPNKRGGRLPQGDALERPAERYGVGAEDACLVGAREVVLQAVTWSKVRQKLRSQ